MLRKLAPAASAALNKRLPWDEFQHPLPASLACLAGREHAPLTGLFQAVVGITDASRPGQSGLERNADPPPFQTAACAGSQEGLRPVGHRLPSSRQAGS